MFRTTIGALALFLVGGTTSYLCAQDSSKGAGSASQAGTSQQTSPRPGSKHNRSARGVHGGSASPGNGRTEVIGYGSTIQSGTTDKPLLPIAQLGNQLGVRSGTPIHVRLSSTVDSAHVHNGDLLDAALAEPLANISAGAPVKLTVVQASPAGALLSFGELSLQVISVAGKSLLSDTISAQGKEGKKEQPDSAPALGTEAVFTSGEVITVPAA